MRPRSTSSVMANQQPTQSGKSSGANSPVINVIINNFRKEKDKIGMIALIIIVIVIVVYVIFIEMYTEEQRKFDDLYRNNFLVSETYIKSRSELENFSKRIPIPKVQWTNNLNRSIIRGLFYSIKDAYQPISDCLTARSCELGWKKWSFCYKAERDWRELKNITRDISSHDLRVTIGYRISEDEIELANLYVIQHVLVKACDKQF